MISKIKCILKTVAPIESLTRANFTGSSDINNGNSGHFQAIDWEEPQPTRLIFMLLKLVTNLGSGLAFVVPLPC